MISGAASKLPQWRRCLSIVSMTSPGCNRLSQTSGFHAMNPKVTDMDAQYAGLLLRNAISFTILRTYIHIYIVKNVVSGLWWGILSCLKQPSIGTW